MVLILNSKIILKNVKDFQANSNRGGILISAKDLNSANIIENILRDNKIESSRFGNSTQFEINCYSISAYDNID